MLNAREIIGFPQLPAEASRDGGPRLPTARFELIAALRRQRQAEIARVTEIAARLAGGFGAETAVGFLYYEILGQPPDGEDFLGYVQRLHQAPSTATAIVAELETYRVIQDRRR
jgi:hypothetical protein